jgi:hypothetical protein
MTGEINITWQTDRLVRLLAKAPKIVLKELVPAMTEASALLEREAKERTPTSGMGTLRDSIGAIPVTISGHRVAGGAETSLSYAIPVELGSAPHWAPLLPLVDWVERKLAKRGTEARQIARMIQLKIAKKGTKGAFMFRDASEAIRTQYFAMIARALDRAEAKIEAQP